ncbi:Peptidase S10, serine carboxypeptidase [Cynara cardunculus var. scolymus]|uniref:Peptidase S10, serine carboxypeptidase n=1 Tax=Cynara cardunculus var. scolymus TaxID=59895 RepID=A0A103IJJ4_CYNCS|nr:Peptidase S10, serine carboxypeptidase [Cynara cardunculus var. scolymus]
MILKTPYVRVILNASMSAQTELTSRIYWIHYICDETNMKPTCREAANIFIDAWANNKDVQEALNVREGIIEKWEYTNTSIRYNLDKEDTIYYSYDVFSSITDHQQLLTKSCQVLIICGDHDMTFPCVGQQKWISSLNLSIESPWEPWFVRN